MLVLLDFEMYDSNLGLEVTYLIKPSFPATMLDSMFPAFDHNMSALHEIFGPFAHSCTWHPDKRHGCMCTAYLTSRFFELGQPLEEGGSSQMCA